MQPTTIPVIVLVGIPGDFGLLRLVVKLCDVGFEVSRDVGKVFPRRIVVA